jgi:2,3-bisphosphoglycerate-independent phosphoglycerate mutase
VKILLIVIDGLGDEIIPQLGNKTPLEAARTPNLDFLAKNGICGLVLPWHEKGKLPTSEDTHLALFGYDPKIANPGRGVLEVLGIGEKIKKGDVCFRGNFATVDENLMIIDRRAGRIEDTEDLIKDLNKIKIKGVKIIVRKAFGHRMGIIFRGKNLSADISSNDPKEIGVKVLKIKGQKRMVKTLEEFLEKAKAILENHPKNKERKKEGKLPANYILVRGAGKLKKFLDFSKKYKLRAGCIAGGTLYKGIGRYLGMDLIKVKKANGLPNTNLKGKILAAKNALKKYDFIFLHIKAADNLAEDGNFFEKKEFIEKLDKNFWPLIKLENVLLIVTGDHSTSSLQKNHCKNPNPILIYGAKKSGCKKFSERECKKGKLGIFKQIDLMKKISILTRDF